MLFCIKDFDFCKKIELKKLACCHCGDLFIQEPVRLDSNVFCCSGCKAVYQILKGVDLEGYYTVKEAPGNIPPKQAPNYDYLDDAKFLSKLVTFRSGSQEHAILSIPSIHCSACIWILEQLHKLISGVVHSSVNFSKKTVYVVYDTQKASLTVIAQKLSSIGYPPHLTMGTHKTDKKKNQSKTLDTNWDCWFCFWEQYVFISSKLF